MNDPTPEPAEDIAEQPAQGEQRKPFHRAAELTSRHGVTGEDLAHWTTTEQHQSTSSGSDEDVPWNPRTFPDAPALPLEEQDLP